MPELEATFKALEEHRSSIGGELRPVNDWLSLRMRRSISWGLRGDAALADDDPDAAFVFYWIAFNAVYGEEREEQTEERERERINRYLQRIVALDREGTIHDALWKKYSGPVRILLENQYVFGPFWKHRNGAPGYDDWQRWFEKDQARSLQALRDEETLTLLTILFDRLYVLRNQLVHGGATWGGSVNRSQVRDGAAIIAFLAPRFIELMLDAPGEDWGPAYYPVI